jgi:hypothetical protein
LLQNKCPAWNIRRIDGFERARLQPCCKKSNEIRGLQPLRERQSISANAFRCSRRFRTLLIQSSIAPEAMQASKRGLLRGSPMLCPKSSLHKWCHPEYPWTRLSAEGYENGRRIDMLPEGARRRAQGEVRRGGSNPGKRAANSSKAPEGRLNSTFSTEREKRVEGPAIEALDQPN